MFLLKHQNLRFLSEHFRSSACGFLLALSVLPFLLLSPQPAFSFEIALFVSSDLPIYQKTLQGFKVASPRGAEIHEFQLGGSLSEGRSIAQTVRASHYDLVVAIGLKAALAAKLEIFDTPVLFCMVLKPEEHGLPTANMTGIQFDVPISQQVATMKRLGGRLRQIGLLYDEVQNSEFVSTAEKEVSLQGLTLHPISVTTPEDVPQALRTLLPQVDLLWLIQDSTVVSPESIKFLLGKAFDHNVPVFAFSPTLVRYGALAGLSIDPKEVGRQAADLARKHILGKDSTPAILVEPSRPQLTLNVSTAEFFDISLDKKDLRLANALFGGPGAVASRPTPEDPSLKGD